MSVQFPFSSLSVVSDCKDNFALIRGPRSLEASIKAQWLTMTFEVKANSTLDVTGISPASFLGGHDQQVFDNCRVEVRRLDL